MPLGILFIELPLNHKFRFESATEGNVYTKTDVEMASRDKVDYHISRYVLIFPVANNEQEEGQE